VFSSWEDMLQLIARALTDNGVRHVRCKGGQTISKVPCAPPRPPSVLLSHASRAPRSSARYTL